MSFLSYESYKDSGVEWLGEVPRHWEIIRIRYITECLDGKRIPLNSEQRADKQGSVPYWGANSIVDYVDDALFDEVLVLLGEDGAPFFDRDRPVAFFSKGRVWPNNHIHVLRPVNSESGKFITHSLNITDYANFIDGSTRDKLTQSQMNNIPIPWPSDIEQKIIVAFLDRETAKIDALITEQQRLIELLKEKRQAVISHAVTKGLNPDASMKDSGIEWLGEVPEHWEFGPLKRFADIIDCKHYTVEFLDEGLPIVSIREVRNDKIDLSNAKLASPSDWEFLREGRVPKLGDLIFCRNASVGAVGYVDFETPFCMGQDVCLIRPDTASRFIHYQLTSPLIRNQIEAFLVGATIRRANVEEIRNLIVVNPTEAEQQIIATFLDRETAKFDTLTAEAQFAIDLLKERRTALISTAVTGKIDVRGLANNITEREAIHAG